MKGPDIVEGLGGADAAPKDDQGGAEQHCCVTHASWRGHSCKHFDSVSIGHVISSSLHAVPFTK